MTRSPFFRRDVVELDLRDGDRMDRDAEERGGSADREERAGDIFMEPPSRLESAARPADSNTPIVPRVFELLASRMDDRAFSWSVGVDQSSFSGARGRPRTHENGVHGFNIEAHGEKGKSFCEP